jgi:hypothetical protein
LITTNKALFVGAGGAGNAGSANGGTGGTPNGPAGVVIAGSAGVVGTIGEGDGGGIVIFGPTTIDDTSITGNFASTHDNDVSGVFTT